MRKRLLMLSAVFILNAVLLFGCGSPEPVGIPEQSAPAGEDAAGMPEEEPLQIVEEQEAEEVEPEMPEEEAPETDMPDLFDYFGANIDHAAADLPELEYDDSYKYAEGTTEISAPTETMEKMSDGYALAGPFFTVDNAGTIVGMNYGGRKYAVCGITVGLPMSEAAEIAKSHGFSFFDAEIAHGTAKYVAIYDNGNMKLCITSDADGEFGKTEESDVTGNVDGILLITKSER